MAAKKPLVLEAGEKRQAQLADELTDGATNPIHTRGLLVLIDYVFSTTTTDSDPGSGKLRLDNATQLSSTAIRADWLDTLGADHASILLIMSNGAIGSGVRLFKTTDPTKWIEFIIAGVSDLVTGYQNLGVTKVSASGTNPFSDNDPVTLVYTRLGTPPNSSSFLSGQDTTWGGIIATTSLSGDVNDWTPTGLENATILIVGATGSTRHIGGITGGRPGRILILCNNSALDVTIDNENTSSTAANRFKLFGGQRLNISPSRMAMFVWNSQASRWFSLQMPFPFVLTDNTTHTFPTTSSVVARTDSGGSPQTFTGRQIFDSVGVAGTVKFTTAYNSFDPLALDIQCTGASVTGQLGRILAPNAADNVRLFQAFGIDWSSGKAGYFGFIRQSTTSNNRFMIGHWGADDIFNVWNSGGMSLDGKNPSSLTDPGDKNFTVAGKMISAGIIRGLVTTVAGLPSSGQTIGDEAYVTDALLPSFLGIVAGGGAVKTPVNWNGSNWVVG